MTARGKSPKYITQSLSDGFSYGGAEYQPMEFESFNVGLSMVNSIVQSGGDPSKKKKTEETPQLTRFQEDQQQQEISPEQEREIEFNTWRQGLNQQRSASAFSSFQSLLDSQPQEDSQESTLEQSTSLSGSDFNFETSNAS